jgi:hypothetical protein
LVTHILCKIKANAYVTIETHIKVVLPHKIWHMPPFFKFFLKPEVEKFTIKSHKTCSEFKIIIAVINTFVS